jgi:hypothetical protein
MINNLLRSVQQIIMVHDVYSIINTFILAVAHITSSDTEARLQYFEPLNHFNFLLFFGC